MSREILQPRMTRTADRALLGSNPIADPGAEIEGWAVHCFNQWTAQPSSLRDWHQRDKPSWPEAAIFLTGCPSPNANVKRPKFQFTVNQDTTFLSQSPAALAGSAPGFGTKPNATFLFLLCAFA